MQVTALYCSDFSLRGAIDPGFKQAVKWNVDLLSGYQSVFLGEAAKQRIPSGFWSLVCPQVWGEIRNGRYDAVLLHGYNYAVNIVALLAAKTKGIPVLMRTETHLGLQRSGWRSLFRDPVLSVAYKLVNGFLAIGTANRAYYRALGVPNGNIFDVPYTVDNDRFIAAAKIQPNQRIAVRRKYGLPVDRPVVLYASKFMRRKHPDDVIRAMALLRDQGMLGTLFMVGTGEMADELRKLAAELGVTDIVFSGFVNQAELPLVYAAADIFVLPAENEPWGLIVNEVMCAGLPVIVSEEVGCVADIVKDRVNGFHTKAGNVGVLAEGLRKLLTDEPLRLRMGAASLSIIQNWSYEQCRIGILAALQKIVQK